jgi:hypothetical protein
MHRGASSGCQTSRSAIGTGIRCRSRRRQTGTVTLASKLAQEPTPLHIISALACRPYQRRFKS